MTSTITCCPSCGSKRVEEAGAVFIEDGPWNGKEYANEGTFDRWQCLDCNCVFGLMPEPMEEDYFEDA